MWILPTHKRPHKLLRFIRSMGEEDKKEFVLLMVWKDDPFRDDYAETMREAPKSWEMYICPERLCGEKMNAAVNIFKGEKFYGFLADDIRIGTPGMLPLLRAAALRGKFAWPNDGVHEIRLSTHPVAPGNFIRTLGFWAHPKFPHNGQDLILYRVATALDICEYRPDLRYIVRHPSLGDKEEMDETYRDALAMNQQAANDMYSFEEKELQPLIQRVKEAYGKENG